MIDPAVQAAGWGVVEVSRIQHSIYAIEMAFGGLATAQAHAAQNLQNARAFSESQLDALAAGTQRLMRIYE